MTAKQTEELYEIFLKYPAISTDSRNITPGSIFFALKGASFDGNRFAIDALNKGAAYAVIDDASIALNDNSGRLFLVTDVLTALQALASHHRSKLATPILAITGTNGKTTTKELLATVLSKTMRIYATRGNLNNHIGVPLTLLAMSRDTEFGIVEMGASAQGEIALLCSIAKPNYGIITNIGRAHLEGFGGEDGVRKGKGELYDYLSMTGATALVRSDDNTLAEMARSRKDLKCEYYNSNIADGFENSLEGDYNKFNIAAAIAAGRMFGVADGDIRNAIREYNPTNNRSQVIKTEHNTLIADCYNANPSSMQAAINNFFGINAAPESKVLILGDMLELGIWSDEEHKRIAELAISGNPAAVYFVGAHFYAASHSISPVANKTSVCFFKDTVELTEYIKNNTPAGKTILIKGSRGISLERIISLL